MILIGIDGGRNIGYAEWDTGKQAFLRISTLDFWDAYASIKMIYECSGSVACIVEDPEQNKPVWVRSNKNIRVYGKICQDVGRVKERTIVLIEGIQRLGIPVIRVRPTKKTGTKLKSEKFKQITGWKKQTSEHARDAAMLVFARSEQSVIRQIQTQNRSKK